MTSKFCFRGLDIAVEYDYQPEEPMVRYYKDGSGYPGCPESVEINAVLLGDYDITELCEEIMDKIEDRLYEFRNNAPDDEI